jgi:hypothetical protein
MPFDKRSENMESAGQILARLSPVIEKQEQEKPAPIKALVDSDLIRPEDIAYVHSVFMQCFLPVRHKPNNRQRWQTDCGRVSMVIRAGELVKPNKPKTFKQCHVPAGPKARIISIYVDDYAWRNQTPEIDMGENLHQAMQQMGIKVGGKNSGELCREVENFAAAEITLGLWMPDGSAHQDVAKVAKSLSFWIEKNQDQRTIWQPTMTLSRDYYASIQESQHIAPVYWPAVIGLQNKARAMDIHRFLTYRLRNGLKRPVVLHQKTLHAMFGGGIKHLYHFWPEFLTALKDAHEWYPTARLEILNDAIKLYDSPPLIPHRKIGRIAHA